MSNKLKPKAKCAAKVTVIANVVLLLALVTATIVQWKKNSCISNCGGDDNEQLKTEHAGRYCFKLGQKQCTEKGYMVKVQGNSSLCCAVLSTHLYNLMAEVLPQRFRSDSSKEEALQKVREMMRKLQNDSSSVDLRPAAHLGILENGTLTGPDSEVPRVYWETSGKSSFITEGIEHGGDRLVIKRAGYYFIYTGLQFTVDPSTVSSGAIVSYVFRDNNNSKTSRRKLMTARESSCRSGRGDHVGPVSVYMAGIFLLHEKDEISVRTASHSLLHRSPATSYMGIHLL